MTSILWLASTRDHSSKLLLDLRDGFCIGLGSGSALGLRGLLSLGLLWPRVCLPALAALAAALATATAPAFRNLLLRRLRLRIFVELPPHRGPNLAGCPYRGLFNKSSRVPSTILSNKWALFCASDIMSASSAIARLLDSNSNFSSRSTSITGSFRKSGFLS